MQRTAIDEPLHAVFDRITDAYVALDRDWRYTYVNARAGQLLLRDPAQLIGRHIWTEFPEGADLPFAHAYRRAMATQRPEFLEDFFPVLGRWFENRVYPSPEGLTVYLNDITERREQEQRLRHQQRMLDEAQQVAHMGSWEWRIGGERVSWTPELFRIYGLAPAEEGPTFAQFMAQVLPEDRPRVQAAIERALAQGQPVEFEERIVHTDGRVRVLSSRGEVLKDADGRPDRMIGVCRDVTELKRAADLEAGEREILAAIAAQRPLEESLARIATLHERLNPGALCSLLLLDATAEHVLHGAAPRRACPANSTAHCTASPSATGAARAAPPRRATSAWWSPTSTRIPTGATIATWCGRTGCTRAGRRRCPARTGARSARSPCITASRANPPRASWPTSTGCCR
jgi:PAS domain S-box-containing protein